MKPVFQVPACVEETRHVVQEDNVAHQVALVCPQGVQLTIAQQCAGAEDVTRQLTGASWHAFSGNASHQDNKILSELNAPCYCDIYSSLSWYFTSIILRISRI